MFVSPTPEIVALTAGRPSADDLRAAEAHEWPSQLQPSIEVDEGGQSITQVHTLVIKERQVKTRLRAAVMSQKPQFMTTMALQTLTSMLRRDHNQRYSLKSTY